MTGHMVRWNKMDEFFRWVRRVYRISFVGLVGGQVVQIIQTSQVGLGGSGGLIESDGQMGLIGQIGWRSTLFVRLDIK